MDDAPDLKLSTFSTGHYIISKPPPWKPNWFQQRMIKLFFGWEWHDA